MMNNVLYVIYAFIGVVFAVMSVALYGIGNVIQDHPIGGVSKNGWSSPAKSTKLSVAFLWVGYVVSGFIIYTGTSVMYIICSFTILVAAILFGLTACAFSFAVLQTMNTRKKLGVNNDTNDS